MSNEVSLKVDVFVPTELVEVVRRHVRNAGDVWSTFVQLQLRVADFKHRPAVRRRGVKLSKQRAADVAPDDMRHPRRRESRLHEGGGGRLAAAARDRGDGPRPALEELGLPRSNRLSGGPCPQDQRLSMKQHALRDVDRITAVGGVFGNRAESYLRAQRLQLGRASGHRVTRPGIECDEPRAARRKKAAEVAALDAESQHCYAAVLQPIVVHLHSGPETLSASATPIMAPAMPTSQKRITTCTSDHPIISKWWWSGAFRRIRLPWVSLK